MDGADEPPAFYASLIACGIALILSLARRTGDGWMGAAGGTPTGGPKLDLAGKEH